jgi:hypothetical protein
MFAVTGQVKPATAMSLHAEMAYRLESEAR